MNWTQWKERLELIDFPLLKIGGTEVSAATLAVFLLLIVFTLLASRLAQRAVRRVFQARGTSDEGTLGVTSRLIHYLVLFVGFGVALHTLGINLTGLFAAGALFAVGIGFAMQNLTANFVSGVILLLERVIKPGDIVEVEGVFLRVRDMGIRSTVARTLDDEDLIIPNSQLVQSTVKNYTFTDPLYRVRVAVGVTYSSDLREVLTILERVAGEMAWCSHERKPRVLLTGFGSSSVDFEVSVWTEDPWSSRTESSELHLAIWWAFQEKGVVIAFPQIDLHLDPPVSESLARLRPAG
jgi:small-conductance mechanosensitive channel